MSSPVTDRPGLLIRDPFHYSDATLIIPPALVECLRQFDGESTELDLRAALVRLTGSLEVGDLVEHLVETLSGSGFLEDEQFFTLRLQRHAAFREAETREPTHAGSAYPNEIAELTVVMNQYTDGLRAPLSNLCGIAAPHVSPAGGWRCYQAAYGALGEEYRDRTFVVIGTSHYGASEHFGLTRKRYVTPFGEAAADLPIVDWLAANGGPAVLMEDYCHAVEHSIEFQVLFLQHQFGADIRVVPILCGSFSQSILNRQEPEQNEGVERFLGALGELAACEGRRLMWVLGIDLAHVGRRYGDSFSAHADQGLMQKVAERDRQRIDRVIAGDAGGFWGLIQENQDDLKWCGAAPLYTFLRAAPGVRGTLLRYEQWNIDDDSVVTFGGLGFQ